jgi:hypothetical protein
MGGKEPNVSVGEISRGLEEADFTLVDEITARLGLMPPDDTS